MKTDIITRMEAMQQRFGRLQLCDRETHVQKFDREIGLDQSSADSWKKRWEAELKDLKEIGEYFDREMANQSDNGALDYLSSEQGEKELGEGWRQ
jgi:hypothetical protein